MQIVNAAEMTGEQLERHLKTLDKAELLAQEITQKSAMHAINTLLRIGCTESHARQMLRSLESFGTLISAECRTRGLATVDHPGGN